MIRYLIGAVIGATLWRIGGWRYKWVRRYILPFLITVNAYAKRKKLAILLTFPLLIGAFALGYGERKPYFVKFLTGVAWIIPRLLFLGFNWWVCLIPFAWVGIFWLSNNKPYSNIFRWWLCEILVGGVLGVAYVG